MKLDEPENPRPARVQLVDSWSDLWSGALVMVDQLGQREGLRLDEAGWMPARQNLLVATRTGRPVAFLVFRVGPIWTEEGTILTKASRPVMEAVVDGMGVVDGQDESQLLRQLREAAMHRALDLRCARFRWDVPEPVLV